MSNPAVHDSSEFSVLSLEFPAPNAELRTQNPELSPQLTDEEAQRLIRQYTAAKSHAETIAANAAALVRAEEQRMARILEANGPALQEWAAARLRGSRRSVRTLEGVAGWRTVPARVSVVDEELAAEWAATMCPHALRQGFDTRALAAELLACATVDPATGERVYPCAPGLSLVPPQDRFYISAGRTTTTPEEVTE